MPASRQASCSQAAPKKRTFHVLIQPDISCATDTARYAALTVPEGKRKITHLQYRRLGQPWGIDHGQEASRVLQKEINDTARGIAENHRPDRRGRPDCR